MGDLTTTGYDRATLAEIRAAIVADVQALISASMNTGSTSILGVLIGIIADALSDNEELAEEVYNMLNPDSAEGTALDNIAALTGTTRLAATQSTDIVSCTGTPATVLPAGRQVSLNTYVWETDGAETIIAAGVWVLGHGYTLGEYCSNGAPDRVYVVITAGTSAGAGGPTGTGADIVDNTVHWRYVGTGLGVVDAEVTAADYGNDPVAYAGNAATIDTPVSGWDIAQFKDDADIGIDEETDAALRLRRALLLTASGNATRDAIRADILSAVGVTECFVFVNDEDIAVGSLPPHSFEAVVLGGTDVVVAQAILGTKSAGITTYGTSSAVATDSEGGSHTMYFTRPSTVDLYVHCHVTHTTDYPTDGDTQIKAAVVAYGNSLDMGDDVIFVELYAAILAIEGVTDVTVLTLDTANPPILTANWVITDHQISAWSTTRVTVTS
jgi:uncharacterized phage protein gp47/JayE